MELPRILIGCPTSSIKDYAFLEWMMHLRQIDYPKDRLDIMMADNSKDNGYEKYLKSWGIKTRRIKPRNRNPMEFLCDSHNAIRKYFLDSNCDYWLHLESDVMIKPQTLRTLLFHIQHINIPIVSASYFHGDDEGTTIIINRLESYGLKKQAMNLKFKESISQSNKFIQVYSCGLGCTLISKDIFKNYNIKFRYDPNVTAVAPDSFFYEDLFKNNIPVYLDTNIILEHNSKDWNHNLDIMIKQNPLTT